MDLANLLRAERKSADLQRLERDFYMQAGSHLSGLENDLSAIEDHYCVEAQIVEDELKSARKSISKLIDLRMKKIVRNVLRRASSQSRSETFDGMTQEEEEIYNQILDSISRGRQNIFNHISRPHTERPLTGKKDIGQEYSAIRLLDSVPTFIGVDGRRYLLTREDVVMIPSLHAKNLCNKNLAVLVDIRPGRSS